MAKQSKYVRSYTTENYLQLAQAYHHIFREKERGAYPKGIHSPVRVVWNWLQLNGDREFWRRSTYKQTRCMIGTLQKIDREIRALGTSNHEALTKGAPGSSTELRKLFPLPRFRPGAYNRRPKVKTVVEPPAPHPELAVTSTQFTIVSGQNGRLVLMIECDQKTADRIWEAVR